MQPNTFIIVDVGFPYVKPTYRLIEPRRHEENEGRKKKISNILLNRTYFHIASDWQVSEATSKQGKRI